MSVVELFDVIPDKLEYWPGETMTGKVVLKVKNGSLQSQGIFLNFKGTASINVLEQFAHTTHRRSFGSRHSTGIGRLHSHTHTSTHVDTTGFSNSENLMSIGTFLAGDGQTLLNLKDGELSYPFSIQLPSRLVSSYARGSGGPLLPYQLSSVQGTAQVSYYFELGMKQPEKADLLSQKIVSIHTILDLSTVPEASPAGEAEATTTYTNCSCCFSSQTGPLSVRLRTPKRGYLPGETIPFEVEVRNQSGKNILGVSAQFIEVAILIGQMRRQNSVTVLGEIMRNPQGDVDNWQGELVVPPEGQVYPSKLGGGCGIIDLDYFLKVAVHVEGWFSPDLEVLSSIIIGTCRS